MTTAYIATGEASIFLYIEEDDPTTLHYHVSVPTDETSDDESESPYWQMAIGQVVILISMAFQSKSRSHGWRMDAKSNWRNNPVNNLENVLHETPTREKKACSREKACTEVTTIQGGKKGSPSPATMT